MSFRLMALLVSIVMAVPAVAAESAANYPSKPIRVVIGFSAGGGVDVSARVIAPTNIWPGRVVIAKLVRTANIKIEN